MDVKVLKATAIAVRLMEIPLFMLNKKSNRNLCVKMRIMINRGKRIKTPNEVNNSKIYIRIIRVF